MSEEEKLRRKAGGGKGGGGGKRQGAELGFTVQEIREVIRYIEDSSSQEADGVIDFGELESAFRRARRTRAATKFEDPGRKAVQRLEEMMKCNKQQTVAAWFEKVNE
jgi:hypothetical protein